MAMGLSVRSPGWYIFLKWSSTLNIISNSKKKQNGTKKKTERKTDTVQCMDRHAGKHADANHRRALTNPNQSLGNVFSAMQGNIMPLSSI